MASNGVFYSGGTGGTGLDLTSGDVTRINISTGGVIKFNNDYTFPTSDGSANTVLLTNGSGSLSFSTIPNASLDNSSITINGSSVSLGGSISVGTVTSVGITAGALIDVSNSPITSSGSITVDVDLSELTTSTNNGDGDFFAVIDSTNVQRKLTKGNINISGFNNDAGFTTNTGTVTSVSISGTDGIDVDSGSPITGSGTIQLGLSNIPNSSLANSSLTVTAGSGLANGGSVSLGGSVTLNVGAGTGIQVNANDVALDYLGTNNFIDSATNLEGTGIATSDTIVYHDATDNNVKKGLVSDLPFSNNSGTVTSVGITAGALIDVSNSPITTSGNITVAVDLSELSTSTTNGDGDFFAVVDASNVQRKLTKGNINISGFNNDAGYTTNTGTVTSVAISGTDGIDVDSGSPITGSGTIQLGLSNVPNSSLANSSVEVVGGNGLTGGGSVSLGGSVTLNVGAGTLIDVDGSNVNVDLSELTTSTANGDGDYFVVVDTANAQKKLTKGNINISGFNNDAGYITSAGNTNIYNTDGSLSSDRILNQANSLLNFRAASDEYFQAFKSNPTPIGTPRVRFEADGAYETVLELHSSEPSTFIVQGYDVAQDPVFNVDGQGNLFAVSKSFLIEHPSDSSMSLRHGSLEGPEHGVYVRGKLDGSNTIELPSYWLDLVDEDSITVQLTPIGSHQNLYVKDIVDNKVIVSNSALLSSKVKCFYFVQAERKDIGKMIVEYPKGTQTI